MFNKIVFSNYYLRKRRDLKKDGKASILKVLEETISIEKLNGFLCRPAESRINR